MMSRMDIGQALSLVDIKDNLLELKEKVTVLTEKVDATPPSPPLIPLLAELMVDIEFLVSNFYTLTLILII